MAIETELKLRITPENLARLKRHPFLRSLSSERATTRKLYSVYFDTPDLQLHHQRMALRLRLVGKQWLQTLKGGGGVQAGLHQRNEWETPVASEKLDFAALEALGATHLPLSIQQQVKPLFVTDFTRSIRMVEFEGALIELGLDSGEIRAGNSSHPISELELELKSGEPLQLFRLALALLDIVPLEIETTSKAEYGYYLHAPIKPIVSKAQTIKLDTQTSVADALQSMIWSCLFHLQANVPGALKKADDEYLQQVRVALRRLRVVLNMVAKHHADTELEYLNDTIAKLGSALGRSREWDVFVTEILPAILKDTVGHAGLMALARKSEKHRQDSHQLVHAALKTSDFPRLLLRFGAWMNGNYWEKFSNAGDLSQFAQQVLHRLCQKMHRRGEGIQGEVNNEQLHKLRIACKNLRYSTELFVSLPGLVINDKQLKKLTKLQDILGKLHDKAVALQLLDELTRDTGRKTGKQIRDEIKHCHLKQLKELRKEWLKLETA